MAQVLIDDRLEPRPSKRFRPIYKQSPLWSNARLPRVDGGSMARLAKDVVKISQPVRTFPNGDYFYVELSRKHNRYDCVLKMAREGNPAKSVVVARAQGKTIKEAEEDCYRKAVERCPRFPRPPYSRRNSKTKIRTERVVSHFLSDRRREPVKG
ncbi:MAG: hypothetical protein HY646_03085 [Acidobacteria bacterium]|nr:hypothetical protein [Acidobacteriota bacterium]